MPAKRNRLQKKVFWVDFLALNKAKADTLDR